MKKAEKMQRTADPSQQNLPGDGAVSAGKAEPPASSVSPDPVVASVSAASDTRLISLERTHDLVAMHALRLSHATNEAMRVVIEPGGGTRLSLELRFNNGSVEAQAVLHRGDFEFLNQHWNELQQRLEPRGVHLAALECSSRSATDQRNSQHSGRQSADETTTRSAFAEFALDGSVPNGPTRPQPRSKTYLGWETWA